MTVAGVKPEIMVKLKWSTPTGAMEGDDSDTGEAGEGENLFKSRLVQRTGIPHFDTLTTTDSNSEFI